MEGENGGTWQFFPRPPKLNLFKLGRKYKGKEGLLIAVSDKIALTLLRTLFSAQMTLLH